MSVLTHLRDRASWAVLSPQEDASIKRSIATLQGRLEGWFPNELKDHFRFGSSTRGTILPRELDPQSDIDYMVVFKDPHSTTQTYLDRLRRFVENNYSRSEFSQSHPSIVLELNHIKFDLVPARESWLDGLQIPDARGGWRATQPLAFSKRLEERNTQCGKLLKPTIRLMKCWNAANNYVFESFKLEGYLAERYYPLCTNLADYVFSAFASLPEEYGMAAWRREKIQRAKTLARQAKQLSSTVLDDGSGERFIQRLIP